VRSLAAVAAAGAALTLAGACGGSAFTAASGDDASTTSDGPSNDGSAGDVSPGADVTPEASPDDASETSITDALDEGPPHCGGDFQCVPAVPGGWTGPLELYLGAAAPPACPSGSSTTFDGMDGLQASAPNCDCSCDSPVIVCGSVTMTTSAAADCATSCETTPVASGSCFASATCAGNPTSAFQTLSSPVATGKCTPQAAVDVPPASWAAYARACASSFAVTQSDCAAGLVCAHLAPAAPFQAGACIVQAGSQACPTAGYVQSHVEYTGLTDTRGCNPCSCGGSGNATCAATVDAYETSNATCGGLSVTFDPPVDCVPTNVGADLRVTVTGSGDPCTPSPGSPTGVATPTGPSTICCTE
jgi:hypothetical protein